jgi:hypothetical protein
MALHMTTSFLERFVVILYLSMILYRVMPARTKNKHNKAKNKQQASRGLKMPSLELGQAIGFANMIPPDVELPNLLELWLEIREQAQGQGEQRYSAHLNRAIEIINEAIDGLPDVFRDFIWMGNAQPRIDDSDLEEHIDGIISNYMFVRETRKSLRAIIHASRSGSDRYPQIPIQAYVYLDSNGILHTMLNEFAEAIDGVEASRIRECAICRRIFWAGRKTQQCCSTACAHALRNRRYRAKYKDYLIRRHMKENGSAEEVSKVLDSRTSKSNTKKGIKE